MAEGCILHGEEPYGRIYVLLWDEAHRANDMEMMQLRLIRRHEHVCVGCCDCGLISTDRGTAVEGTATWVQLMLNPSISFSSLVCEAGAIGAHS